MDTDAFRNVLDGYEAHLHLLTGPFPRADTDWIKCNRVVDSDVKWSHALVMLTKMRVMLTEGKDSKFFRWLGFVQGIMWSTGLYSIDELRSHNRGICS